MMKRTLTVAGLLLSVASCQSSSPLDNGHQLEVAETLQEHQELQQPWASREDCALPNYNYSGIHPKLIKIISELSLEHRITQGLNLSNVPSNYHGPDVSENGQDFTFSVDLSIRCLETAEIKQLLNTLADNKIIAWARLRGLDGWPDRDPFQNHIHSVFVLGTLKPQLKNQVSAWLDGRNGLTSDLPYSYWQPSMEAINAISEHQ